MVNCFMLQRGREREGEEINTSCRKNHLHVSFFSQVGIDVEDEEHGVSIQ